MNLDDSVHLNDLDVKTNGGMEEASIMISSDAMLNKQAQNKTSDNCVKHIIQSKATQNEANVHKTISEEETIKHNFKFLPFRESQNVNDDTLPPFLSGLIPSVTIGDGENDIFPIKENSCVIIDKFADDSFSTHKVNWVNDYGKHLIQSKATQNEANVHKTISEEETIKHNFQFLPFRESQNVNVNTLPPFLSGLIPSVNIIEDDDGFSTLCQGSSDNDSGSSSDIVVVNESEHDDSSILLEDYNHNNASSNYINVMKENVHNDFVLSERSSDNDSGSSSDIVVIDEIVHDDSDVLLKEENSHIDNRPFNDTDVVKENMNENYLISSEEDAGSSQSESSEFDVIEMKNFHDDCYVSSEEDEPLWSVDLVENENPCDAVLSEPRSFCCNENKSELSLNINNEDEHSYIDNNELYNLYEINNFLMNETIADICHPLLQSYTSENEHSSMPSPLMRTRQKFRRSGNLDDPESPHSDSELSLDINGRDMSEVSNPPIDHLCHVSRPSYTGENEDSSMLSPLVSTRQRLGLLNDHVSETLLTLSSNDLFRSFCFAVTLLLLASVAILVAVSHKSTQMEKIMDEYKTENNKLVDQMQLKIENYKLIIDLEEQIKLLRDENSLLNSQIHDLHKKVAVMFKSVETSFNSEIRKLKRIINDLPIDNMRFNRQLAKISNGSVAPAIEENKELKNEANITDIKYNSAENIIEEFEGLRKTFHDARQKNVKKYIENLIKENNTNENKQSFEHKESSSENTEFVFKEVMGKMLSSLIKKMLHSFDKKIKIWLESNENLKEGSNKDENIFGNKESSSTQKKYKSIYKMLKKEIYQLFEKEFGTFANKFDMEYFINSLVSQMNEVFGENSQCSVRQNVKKPYKSIHYFLKNISKMISKALIFKRDRNEDTFDESHSINNAKLANEPPKENEAAPEERNISLWPFFRAASRSQLRAEQQEAINWFLRKWRNRDITTYVDMIDKLVFATENRKPSDVDE